MQVSQGMKRGLILPVLITGATFLSHFSRQAVNHYQLPSFSLLADRCMCMKQVHQVHAQMIVFGCIQDNFAASRIMAFCALSSEGDLNYALRLFYHTCEPNTFMWNTIIRALALSPSPQNAILLYKQMKSHGIMPGKHTFPFLLKACTKVVALSSGQQAHAHILKNGFEFDIYVANALLRMYACCGSLECARQLFDNMPERNVIVWTTMISGYAQNSCSESALTLFNEMVEAGVKPNGVTICSVLSSCAKSGDLVLGERVHSFLKREGIEIGVILGTALIDMYAKNGRIEVATKLFNDMSERNSATWNALICGLAMHGHVDHSLYLYSKMQKEETLLPNDITFVGVLSACCHVGLVDIGQEIFDSMDRIYGIKPKIEHYGCMVDLLGRAGRLREAKELIEKMDVRPDVVVLGALLGACKMHGNIEIAERVVKQILKLEPQNHGVYVVLSNMYAEVGKWEDVMRLRKTMKVGGLKKLPGYSLVESNRACKAHNATPKLMDAFRHLEEQLSINRLNEFGTDGGPAIKQFAPKYNLFKGHVTKSLGVQLPPVEIKHLVAAAIALEGIGGVLFIFGSTFGASLLLIYLALATPILHDFYNYDIEKPQFMPAFSEFVQNLALFGALVFFLGMKNSFPKKPRKKVLKTKTN